MNRLNKKAIAAALLAASLSFGAISNAQAESRALIMTIADYPVKPLQPVVYDAISAKRIATAMGVPPQNVSTYADRQLTLAGMKSAMQSFAASVAKGDNVLIYYSGHGSQDSKPGSAGECREMLVPIDFTSNNYTGLYDDELERYLVDLASRASRVIVMNDSCFSGGAATKASAGGLTKSFNKNSDGYQCGNELNKSFTRAAQKSVTSNMVYLAASSSREVSLIMSDGSGSTGTKAWEQCLGVGADRNGSGSVDARELTECAGAKINQWLASGLTPKPQTPTVLGNEKLPISFVATSATSTDNTSQQAVDPVASMRDLVANAAGDIRVELSTGVPSMKIGQDALDLNVTTNRAGYLTLFYVGSDGKTVDVLFPNDLDSNDFIQPGSHRFPRANWKLRAGGPAGTNHIVALVSSAKKDFRKIGSKYAAFTRAKANNLMGRNLNVIATGTDTAECKKNLDVVAAGCGTYGASQILQVREVQ